MYGAGRYLDELETQEEKMRQHGLSSHGRIKVDVVCTNFVKQF